MHEFDYIHKFLKPLAKNYPGAFALSDDVACLSVASDQQLLVSTDTLVENVHFFTQDSPEKLACKMLRVNISDIVAKGARPFAYSLAISWPERLDENWWSAFAAGLQEDQDRYQVSLIGGDLTQTSGPLVLSVTIYGQTSHIVRRASSVAGAEKLYVTGPIGDAALGLLVLKGQLQISSEKHRNYLQECYHLPKPPFQQVDSIREYANAALDISDGLLADCLHLCQQSGKKARIFQEKIPLSMAAKEALNQDPTLWQAIVAGGDDYQTLCSSDQKEIPDSLVEIGDFVPGPPEVLLLDPEHHEIRTVQKGWVHF